MLGYRKGVKKCWGEEQRFFNWMLSESELKVVFDTACYGGIGSCYGFLLSEVK